MYDDWYKNGITAELLSVPSRLVVLGRLAERSQLGDRRGLGGLGHSGSNDEGVAWVEGERRVGQEGRLGGSNAAAAAEGVGDNEEDALAATVGGTLERALGAPEA